MENKELTVIILVLAVTFAIISVVSDIAVTGSSIKEADNLSLNFSIITIVLITILLLSLLIELYKFKIKN